MILKTVSRGVPLTLCLVLLVLCGCGTFVSGELDEARFQLGGGVHTYLLGTWSVSDPIAQGTVFTVEASAIDELVGLDLRSSNEEVLVFSEEDNGLPSDTRVFVAEGVGRAAVELFTVATGELVDFVVVDVAEAASLQLLRASGERVGFERELAPETFGVVAGVPVRLKVELRDSTDHVMNHHGVVVAQATPEEVLAVDSGETLVYLDGAELGTTDLVLSVPGQPASGTWSVSSLDESDVTRLDLRRIDECGSDDFLMAADLFSGDDLPVLGVPVSWQVEGTSELVIEEEDYVRIRWEDEQSEPVTVTAVALGLTESASLERSALCPPEGCSVSAQGRGARPIVGLALLLLVGAMRRRVLGPGGSRAGHAARR